MSLAMLQMLAIFPAALLAVWSLSSLRAEKRPVTRRFQWKHLFLAVFGFAIAFGAGGAIASYRIQHASRIHAQGAVHELENHEGKSSSTTFSVLTSEGISTPELTSLYASNHLHDGDAVDVVYLTDYNEILSLRKTNPADPAWSFHRDDDLGRAHICRAIGLILAFIAVALFAKWVSLPKSENS